MGKLRSLVMIYRIIRRCRFSTSISTDVLNLRIFFFMHKKCKPFWFLVLYLISFFYELFLYIFLYFILSCKISALEFFLSAKMRMPILMRMVHGCGYLIHHWYLILSEWRGYRSRFSNRKAFVEIWKPSVRTGKLLWVFESLPFEQEKMYGHLKGGRTISPRIIRPRTIRP